MSGGQVLLAVGAGAVLAAGAVSAAVLPWLASGAVTVAYPAHVTARAAGGRCVVGGAPRGGGGHGLVRLTPGAAGATVIWLPGFNDPCRIATTHLTGADAEQFVIAVNTAKRFPSGPIDCSDADGSAVLVYVSHAGEKALQLVIVGGCDSLTAPGRSASMFTRDLALGTDPLTR